MLGGDAGKNSKEVEVTLISDKENTAFYIKVSTAISKTYLGTGRFVRAKIPKVSEMQIFAKPPGYKEKSFSIQEAMDPIRFVFLEEEKVLTIKSEIENTEYFIRIHGQTSWQTIGKGAEIEYWIPREGQFEIKAQPNGKGFLIQTVINRTGQMSFTDYPAEGGGGVEDVLRSDSNSQRTCKVLFLAANPTNTMYLKLDEECREIEIKIRASDQRDMIELITKWAVRPNDLLQYLNQYHPKVVHFSGHGSDKEEIILQDQNGNIKPVSAEALKKLFSTLKGDIKVVILNACYSKKQAEAITEVIDCAIGMNKAIGDNAAIAFAAAFYQAIGYKHSVKEAFDSGIAAIMLENIKQENIPVLLYNKNIDPSKTYLIQ